MDLLIAFGTDDEKSLKRDHVGKSTYFHVYKFSGGKEEFIERRENVKYKEDESMILGDPGKARATSTVLKGLDCVVGRRFGPNLTRLSKKLVCVVVRTETISKAIQAVHENMNGIIEEKNKSENRKHIVLTV
jgi:predicted Fe-Mo cluster-binding NifX family protein